MNSVLGYARTLFIGGAAPESPDFQAAVLHIHEILSDVARHLELGTEIVKMDLEGMVCKRKSSPYRINEKPSAYWIKVKNPSYSQAEGRERNCSSIAPDKNGS